MANFASWAQFFGLVFVSYLFIRKLGNGATFRFGAVLVGIGSLIQLYSGSTRLILLANMIVGIGFAAMLCTQYACNADLAGHLSDTVGFNVIGVASTGATFGAKIGNGLGSFILGLFLEIGHYKSTQTNFTAVTVKAIRGAYIWTPFICAVIVVILMYCFYHVDAELKAIQQKK